MSELGCVTASGGRELGTMMAMAIEANAVGGLHILRDASSA